MTSIHYIFILLLLFIHVTSGLAQNDKKLFNQVKDGIEKAAAYDYWKGDEYDVDSVCTVTIKRLVNILKSKQLSSKEEQTLGFENELSIQDSSNIKIYHIDYSSGGSRGYVNHPVIQWTNKQGQPFAYDFSKYIYCHFYEIKKLKSKKYDLYLLLGTERGNYACIHHVAYVIQIKGDYLILDYPAFNKQAYLMMCDVELTFNENKQELLLNGDYYYEIEFLSFNKQYPSKEEREEFYDWMMEGEEPKFQLNFNGYKFK